MVTRPGRSRPSSRDTASRVRGQAFTLEAFVASLLLLSALTVALQSTAVTPLSSSSSHRHLENQQGDVARGALDAAAANDSLRPAVLYWNESVGRFHGTGQEGYYPLGGPPLPFGDLLNRTFSERTIAFNVNVYYVVSGGERRGEQLVYMGTPTENGVRATHSLTLHDDDVLYAADGTPTNTPLTNASTFYVPDVQPSGPVYNVVQIEVIVWQM